LLLNTILTKQAASILQVHQKSNLLNLGILGE